MYYKAEPIADHTLCSTTITWSVLPKISVIKKRINMKFWWQSWWAYDRHIFNEFAIKM